MTDYIEGLLYDKKNCWVKLDGNTATIGITRPSADKVEEFMFIELPKKGEELHRDGELCTLEAMKWSGTVASPLSGKIIEVNSELEDEPGLINQDPYKAWIVKLEISDKKEIDDLVDQEEIAG